MRVSFGQFKRPVWETGTNQGTRNGKNVPIKEENWDEQTQDKQNGNINAKDDEWPTLLYPGGGVGRKGEAEDGPPGGDVDQHGSRPVRVALDGIRLEDGEAG